MHCQCEQLQTYTQCLMHEAHHHNILGMSGMQLNTYNALYTYQAQCQECNTYIVYKYNTLHLVLKKKSIHMYIYYSTLYYINEESSSKKHEHNVITCNQQHNWLPRCALANHYVMCTIYYTCSNEISKKVVTAQQYGP